MKIEAIWQPENQQRIFRALMEAMARPGSVHCLGNWLDGTHGYRGVLASLLDIQSTLSDCHNLLEAGDWPLLQARPEVVEKADYLLCRGNAQPSGDPKVGTLSCPDQSATLLVQIEALGHGKQTLVLRGPGIKTSCTLQLEGFGAGWLELREQSLSFPLGIDIILVDQHSVTAIPRTSRLEVRS
ncbi:MAG: phosphonate C-P lyase system protein PhnH [Desulfobulbaceae bacterium]|uniref:Phosphonate C-P lyase system protein PhnH n=1 Tax=Candidatus Desulfobia pelagia TaxID=2841692 RepID=A0A8J6TG47_9BACT|nr:phosphonate C-P lyase system protein PhnH [Candidatus Desulfobia pelagia]